MAGKVEKLPNKTPRPIEGHKPAAAVLRGVVDKVYAEQFNDVLPARSAFQVAALPLGGNIEIEVIAVEK